jgi:hypothetical protein
MWKETALAVAVLAPAAASRLFDVRAPQPARAAAPVPGATFAATCRDGQLIDSRPDPAWVRQSFNRDNCTAAPMPAALDGARASRPEIVAAMAAAKAYAGAAETFQKCVADFVATRPGLTPNERIIENHRIAASQKSVERAAAQTRVAINAFNAYGSGCDD